MVNPASFLMTAGVMGGRLAVGRFAGALLLGTVVGGLMQRLARRSIQRSFRDGSGGAGGGQGLPPPAHCRFVRSWFVAGQMFLSLLRYVGAGVILGGILAVALDPRRVAPYLTGELAIPFAALAGVPLYLCSCAEIPVALSLVRKGLDPAAVLTFLLAGPGVSVFSVVLLSSLLRVRAILLYMGVFLTGSVAVGYLWQTVTYGLPRLL
jgi:uncharacterized membrane protein YraQ (UPF0718 family)